MKAAVALLFGAFLAAAADSVDAEAAVVDQPLEEYITGALLRLKKEVAAGIPDLDIPPMDPFALPDDVARVSNALMDLTLAFKDATATGPSTYDPRSVSVVDGRLEMRLAFPSLMFSGDYSLVGTVLKLPVRAEASADFFYVDVGAVCSASVDVAVDGGGASLSGFRTRLSVGGSLLLLRRFAFDDGILKAALRKLADAMFEKYRPVLEAGLSDALTKGLNAALALRGGAAAAGEKRYALELPAVKVYEAGNANEFLDHMISQARPALAEKDPLTLPEARKGFERVILGARVHGEAKIYDGFLAGIQTIHRTGDAELTQSPDFTKMIISAHMGMANLHGHYRMHAKFMNMGPTGEISLKVSMVSCEVKVVVDMSTGKPKATLEHFDINYIGKIDLYFDGLGPLDWLINPLGGWIINLVKERIADAVEGPLKKIIQSKMDNADIPIGMGYY